jgi:tetratricopeptide (TPR) repeat protein
VDKSLLRQEEGVAGDPRFRMLETVREFGLERLEASGEEAASRSRHAGFFLALLERGDRDLVDSTRDTTWIDAIDRDHDNVRAALGWSRDTGADDMLLRLAGALVWFWYYRGHLNEGRGWLEQAVHTPPDAATTRLRAWAFTALGLLANVSGATDRAAAALMASFAWWEQSGDAYGQAIARSLLGGVCVTQGRYDEAAALFAANEALLRDGGNEGWLGHAHFHLGVIAWMQGGDARARTLLRDAVERYDRAGVSAHAIDPLRYLGLMATAAGDLDDAARWFRDEVARLQQRGSRAAIAVGLADVATLAAAREAWHPALRLFAKAEALLKTEAAAFSLPARDHYERAHARARAALGDAAAAAAAAGRALSLEQALAETDAVLNLNRVGSASPAL